MSKTVLVTGASGFIAAHVINEFLQAGYKVRGTVRSAQSAENVLKTTFAKKYGDSLSLVVVKDMTLKGAFDDAVKGVDGVIHTQSPFTPNIEDNERDMLIPAIHGTRGILESVKNNNPSVKRIVITSSFAAIADASKAPNQPDKTYSEKDWNPATYEEAKVSTDGSFTYCASKALAEKAAWDFLETEKPNFTLATICPPPVYGPNLHYFESLSQLNTSSGMFYSLMNGSRVGSAIPPTRYPAVVDVRDVAKAHLLAYEKPEAANQRYFCTEGPFTFDEICVILRKNFPELKDKVPEVPADYSYEKALSTVFKVDNSKIKKQLGIKFYNLEQVVVDTAKDLLSRL